MGNGRKFGIVLWKNFKLKQRHWIVTSIELIVPIILFVVLVILRAQVEFGNEYSTNAQLANERGYFFYDSYWNEAPYGGSGMSSSVSFNNMCGRTGKFYLIPNNTEFVETMQDNLNAAILTNCKENDDNPYVDLLPNEAALADIYEQYVLDAQFSYPGYFISGAAVFTDTQEFDSTKGLAYKLRFCYDDEWYQEVETDQLFYNPFQGDATESDYSVYASEAYESFWHTIVELAYIQEQIPNREELLLAMSGNLSDNTIRYGVADDGMTIPGFAENNIAQAMQIMLPIFSILSYMFVVPVLLKRIVHEKEGGVKEFMRMMGLPGYLHWSAWFLTAFASCLVTVFIIMLLLCVDFKYGALIQYTDVGLIFFTYTFYSISLILMMFAISAFFNNANLALTAGLVVHLITYFVPYGVFANSPDSYHMGLGGKMGLCLFPNIALWWSLNGMLRYESSAIGLTFKTIDLPLNGSDDELTLGLVWVMFVVSAIIYWTILWYMDKVKPGPFGQALVPYFFVLPTYWCDKKVEDDGIPENDANKIDPTAFEPEPEGTPAVVVRNLRKTFRTLGGATVRAVKDVSFSAYPGELMALLGHNGAGKTTTMSMLTGLHNSNGGTATVNGFDINTSMDSIRGDMGLCPQHNMLFPSLTVREHIFFFGMMKGLSWSESQAQSHTTAEEVMLGAKKDNMTNQLSGGMKRKLHLGIAMVGNSKVILLDEPTSGMDPEARRQIWDLLHSFKAGRTLILTTHFMEEADQLGDRIAIMADGRVQCYGSSLFLKKVYGSGYRLTMTKTKTCNPRTIKDMIRVHVPSAKTITNVSGELSLSLPSEEEHGFAELLKELAMNKESLGVTAFGLSVTTLEDVFLRVGESKAMEKDDDNEGQMNNGYTGNANMDRVHALQRQGSIDSLEGQKNQQTIQEIRKDYATGMKLWMMQVKGLFQKRVIQTKRNFIMYFLMSLAPIGLAITSVITMNITQTEETSHLAEPLLMTLNDYPDAISMIESTYLATEEAEIYTAMRDFLGRYPTEVTEVPDLINYPLDKASTGIGAYSRDFILGGKLLPVDAQNLYKNDFVNGIYEYYNLTFTELNFHFQVKGYHTRPLVRNIMSNILYNALVPPVGNSAIEDREIKVTYEPIVIENDWSGGWSDGSEIVYPSTVTYATMLGVGWILFVATFIIFPIRERLTNAKQVQIMAGVHPVNFWLSNLAWDLMLFTIVAGITTGILVGVDERNIFATNGAGGAFFLIYFLFGLGGILMAYVFSFAANSAPSAFSFFVIISLVFGIIMPQTVLFLDLARDTNSKIDLGALADGLRYTFTWLPCFPQTRAMMALLQVQEGNNRCHNYITETVLYSMCHRFATDPEFLHDHYSQYKEVTMCCSPEFVPTEDDQVCGTVMRYTDSWTNETGVVAAFPCFKNKEFFTWDSSTGINIDIVFLLVDFFIMLAFLVGLESGYVQMYWKELKYKMKGKPNPIPEVEFDDDVQAEREVAELNIGQTESSDDGSVLVVNDMTKRFGKFTAVKGLSFTVKGGECFGFLGVNGAGKTTSFRMLTGDEYMTKGMASMYGVDIKKDKRKFFRMIGYCPQFDSIIEVLTGREMLNLFAHIRGIPGSKRKAEIQKWIEFVGLEQYADRKCGSYSGGNKRKLNVAQALVGDPPIIFLDEPSTGVDPVARRRLWDTISAIKKNGQSVVLTSHSMEECEALCDRLAIMVNGQFRCFGGPQHLKNKFGQGFTVIIKLSRSTEEEGGQDTEGMNKIKEYMDSKFGQVEVKDEHADYLHFHIGDTDTPWHHLFETMQQAKTYFPFIQDYSLSETSLEEVFLMFARTQESK